MPKGTSLTEFEKGQIESLKNEGKSLRYIAAAINRSVKAVWNVINNKNGSRRTGRPKINSERTIRSLGREANKHRGLTANELAARTKAKGQRSTICRLLKSDLALKYMTPAKKPMLKKIHKESRLIWAKENHRIDFVNGVIWSDEKKFCFQGPDGFYKAWVAERDNFTICKNRNCGGVHIWAAFIADTLIGPYILPERSTFNTTRYIDILKSHLVPFIRSKRGKRPLFQQDNAPPHKSEETRTFLERENIKILPFPSMSPDLNPIENIWSAISSAIYQYGKVYSNRTELQNAIVSECENIRINKKQLLLDLAKSVEMRCLNVIEARGSYTKY